MTVSHPMPLAFRTRRVSRVAATALTLLALTFPPTPIAAQHPTPKISYIEKLRIPGAIAYAMRARLSGSDTIVGLSILCAFDPPGRVEVTAYFGPYPRDRRPVQLALRTASGTVQRFGRVIRGGLTAGFHSPRITDPAQARKFVTAALSPRTLVSNGYRSFWNQATQPANSLAKTAFMHCLNSTDP